MKLRLKREMYFYRINRHLTTSDSVKADDCYGARTRQEEYLWSSVCVAMEADVQNQHWDMMKCMHWASVLPMKEHKNQNKDEEISY